MVGTSFPYSEFLPQEGKARGVQIDLDGRMLGLRYPTEVNLVGDSRDACSALLPLAAAQGRPRVARQVEAGVAEVVARAGSARP
jgi:pyruvate dehydrogenase (quinone)